MAFEFFKESIQFPEIARELKERVAIDQRMREESLNNDDLWNDAVDRENTERMKEIVAEIGFPTISKVGEEGAHFAWLLVQHADHDVAFQEQCLGLMKEASPEEVSMIDIAYLEDRARVNQGKGQLYGTQFMQEDGKHIPRMIEDEEKVDERRAKIGMGPLSEQIELMYTKYPLEKENPS